MVFESSALLGQCWKVIWLLPWGDKDTTVPEKLPGTGKEGSLGSDPGLPRVGLAVDTAQVMSLPTFLRPTEDKGEGPEP
jgi:hypothetical protein